MSDAARIRDGAFHLARPRWWTAARVAATFFLVVGVCAAQSSPGQTPAASAPLSSLLLARKYVQDYFDKFSSLTCKESVTQFVINESGHALYRESSAYDYQFEGASAGGSFKFNETREVRSPAYRDPGRTLLVTTGFASLLLVAHPAYEASYTFEPAGDEAMDGVNYSKIRFAAVPGASSPASLRLRGKNYPLPLTGTLWIDPRSGAIAKLVAQVDSSLSDLGLAGMRSEVQYAQHAFREPADSIWVAESAVIEVATPRQHWRNVHKFSDYKRFNVNIQEEMGKVQ